MRGCAVRVAAVAALSACIDCVAIDDRVRAYEAFHRSSAVERSTPLFLLRISDRGIGDNLHNDVIPFLGFDLRGSSAT